jgi:arylsulfatase A-like enzyme
MNTAQKAFFKVYYSLVEKDFLSKHLIGKELTEWKFQRYMNDYLSTAISLDRNIGRIMDYLDRNHLTNNTLLVYTSDQGFYLGEHGWFDKRFMYEESFKTPLLMRYPGVIKLGSKFDDLVVNIDFAPTFLDAAHVKVPQEIQGKSILPLLSKGNTKWRKGVYYHYYEYGEHSVIPHFGIRTSHYKLIRFYQAADKWELYDLKDDPQEMNNIYGKPGYEKITLSLKAGLTQLINQYQDQEAGDILRKEENRK